MHHIKKDKRCEKTVEIIYSALLRLLTTKDIDSITITDICNTSYVSRSTFYRSFDTPIDVLLYKCEKEFELLFDQYIEQCKDQETGYKNYTFLLHFYSFFENREGPTQLLIEIGRFDNIYLSGIKMAERISEVFFMPLLKNPDDYKYFISIRAGLALSLLSTWIQNGKEKSIEELMSILRVSSTLGGHT